MGAGGIAQSNYSRITAASDLCGCALPIDLEDLCNPACAHQSITDIAAPRFNSSAHLAGQ